MQFLFGRIVHTVESDHLAVDFDWRCHKGIDTLRFQPFIDGFACFFAFFNVMDDDIVGFLILCKPCFNDAFIRHILQVTEWRKINPPVEDSKLKKEEAEKRKTLREFVGTAIREHVLETKEKTLISYRGFDIVLPANMTLEKPYVWLKKSGKYYVELGDTDIGNLIRIDNYLDSLGDHLSKLTLNLEKLREKEKDIRFELSKGESYINQIETYKNKVKNLDKKLGVYKK